MASRAPSSMTSRSNSGACRRTAVTTDSIDASSLYAGMATSRRFGTMVTCELAHGILHEIGGSDRRHEVEVPYSPLRSNGDKARCVAVLLTIVTTLLLVRNLALESPLMSGDEYAYFAAAQTFPDSAERYASDQYLPRIYSPVFAAYGRTFFSLSDRPELLLKALNTICFALTTLLFLRLVKALGGVNASPVCAAVFLLLPISTYTAYFMPETTYAFLFALLTWAVVYLLPTHLFTGTMLSGALVGTMLLVKPHALAVFIAVLLTLGALFMAPPALRPSRRRLLACVALFILSAYVTLAGVNGILTRHLQLHPLMFVGDLYRSYLSQGAMLTSWVGKTRLLFGILCGHLIVFGAVLAPPAALGAAHMRRLYVKQPSAVAADSSRDGRLFALICFTASATLLTVGMTISPPRRLKCLRRNIFASTAGTTRSCSRSTWFCTSGLAGKTGAFRQATRGFASAQPLDVSRLGCCTTSRADESSTGSTIQRHSHFRHGTVSHGWGSRESRLRCSRTPAPQLRSPVMR